MAKRLSEILNAKKQNKGKSESFAKTSIKNSQTVNDQNVQSRRNNFNVLTNTPTHSSNSSFISDSMQKTTNSTNPGGFFKIKEFEDSYRKETLKISVSAKNKSVVNISLKFSRFEIRAKGLNDRNKAKIVLIPIYHITFYYKDRKVGECESNNCDETLSEVSKATKRNVTIKELRDNIDNIISKKTLEVKLIDIVTQLPEFKDIEKNPYEWLFKKTSKIVGNEKFKKYIAYAITSSQIELDNDDLRFNIGIEGSSGEGKTKTIEAVLDLLLRGESLEDEIVIIADVITKEAITWLDGYNWDGRILYVNQIDGLNLERLRPILSEGRINKFVTEQTTDGFRVRTLRVYGKPALIYSIVTDKYDITLEQLLNRTWRAYLPSDDDEKLRAIIRNKALKLYEKVTDVDRLIFTGYILTRPRNVEFDEKAVKLLEDFLMDLKQLTNDDRVAKRRLDILLAFLKAKASFEGRNLITLEYLRDVLEGEFRFDIMYNVVGISEREFKVLEALYELTKSLREDDDIANYPKTRVIAEESNFDDSITRDVLESLRGKHLVISERIGTAYHWKITTIGKRLLSYFEHSDDVIETDTGIAENDFFHDDGKRDSSNAMRSNDARGMSESNGKDAETMEGGTEDIMTLDAYKYLKSHGTIALRDFIDAFGTDAFEKLKDRLETFTADNEIYIRLRDVNNVCEKFDGMEYDDRNDIMADCLHKAKAYIDRTTDERGIFRVIKYL
ncbi:hypothetical protein SJAV_13270 [Sulfurisphaera javensis]|uniref:Uncharacterized protein n=1 Tax=Sulfurisphaera javensis TaxID=2049879 RepID=A0AAT9GR94_9CREN